MPVYDWCVVVINDTWTASQVNVVHLHVLHACDRCIGDTANIKQSFYSGIQLNFPARNRLEYIYVKQTNLSRITVTLLLYFENRDASASTDDFKLYSAVTIELLCFFLAFMFDTLPLTIPFRVFRYEQVEIPFFSFQDLITSLMATSPLFAYLIWNVFSPICRIRLSLAEYRSNLVDSFKYNLKTCLVTGVFQKFWFVYIAFRRQITTLLFKASFNNDRTWWRQ